VFYKNSGPGKFYKLKGDGSFPFLVYEGFRNHDGPTTSNPKSLVRREIKERNRKRKNILNISKNGLHYSWS